MKNSPRTISIEFIKRACESLSRVWLPGEPGRYLLKQSMAYVCRAMQHLNPSDSAHAHLKMALEHVVCIDKNFPKTIPYNVRWATQNMHDAMRELMAEDRNEAA